MTEAARAGHYKTGERTTRLTAAPPARPAVAAARAASSPVEELLQLLARAVQQLHTYPPTSSMCVNAVDGCARALVSLDRDQLVFRVAPFELIVDEAPVGRGTAVEQELARRLHAAGVAEVAIDRSASPRELSHFCLDLVRCSAAGGHNLALIDVLAEHGVDRIALRAAYRPEVLPVAAADESVTALVEVERRRRDELFAGAGAVNHLYPPDRGWVRVDPASAFASVSLVELALLAENPERLAAMLMRLTDDDPGERESDALTRKFSDVATLFSALEPRVARVMFSRLARAVLALEPESQRALLRRTILPGLLDGRVDGMVLRDFPDLELADSLCLLLDLETAAPELVTTALGRLELTQERQAALAPLVEERLSARAGRASPEDGLDAHAKRLLKVERTDARDFAEFSAYDLALDPATAESLTHIRDGILTHDRVVARLECLWQLTRLEPNPDVVQAFVESAATLLEELGREQRHDLLAAWMLRYRALADALRESRPDVAGLVAARLAAMCTPARASHLADLALSGETGRSLANTFVRALTPAIGMALLEVAQARPADGREGRAKAAVQILCDHAGSFAAVLSAAAATAEPAARRIIVRVLGWAGAGVEATVAGQIDSGDEQTIREALRSLARIGTSDAARFVCRQIASASGWIPGAAEEALWRFPSAEAHRHARALLGQHEFVLRRPAAALRLIERAAQGTNGTLAPVLEPLVRLRYRIWSPALARVGRRAHELVNR